MQLRINALLTASAMILAACSDSKPPEITLGYVEAEWAYVAAPSSGWIVNGPPSEGSRITAGDLLFTLDSDSAMHSADEFRARLSQAQAQYRNLLSGAREPELKRLQARQAEAEARLSFSKLEYARIVPLVEKGLEQQAKADQAETNLDIARAAASAAREDIEVAQLAGRPDERAAAEAAVNVAQASLDNALYELEERSIEARLEGRIAEVFYRTGEFVKQGDNVVALMRNDGLKVRFNVPQSDLPTLQIGSPVSVRADGAAQPIQGKVSYIADDAEFVPPVLYTRQTRQKLVFLVEARIPVGDGLHPGLPVEVSW
jgi:HlyD family secretion protein